MGLEMEVEVEVEAEAESPDDDATATATASKACADCHTTKTPLWRGGPEGPKVRRRASSGFSIDLPRGLSIWFP
jgi:cytochrome c2